MGKSIESRGRQIIIQNYDKAIGSLGPGILEVPRCYLYKIELLSNPNLGASLHDHYGFDGRVLEIHVG